MSYFAFNPSDNLRHEIEQIIALKHSQEQLYPLRDNLVFRMNDEVIDALLTGLIQVLPESDKRNMAEKLANTIKTTVYTLLKQLLSKASNAEVQASIQFIEQSYYHIDHTVKFGMPLEATFAQQLNDYYQAIHDQQAIDLATLTGLYKQFADKIIQYFMIDFNQTLNLGLIKRKTAELASSATIKAVHLAIDKILPNLKQNELELMADYHRQFLIQ